MTATDLSYCNNLSIIPRLQYLVAVGVIKSAFPRTSALILLTDSELNSIAIKVFSYTNDAYSAAEVSTIGGDVAVAQADGSIFVTGTINGGFFKDNLNVPLSTFSDCFILKLDMQLNQIFAKSFGYGSSSLQCLSLQVTRNSDFLYFGGYSGVNLWFGKSDGYLNNLVSTTLSPSPVTDALTLRRIILESDTAFTYNDQDNARLFFCGAVNNADFIFGYLTSGDVTDFDGTMTGTPGKSADQLIKIEKVYKYGSSDTEKIGDCALSEDNGQIVGVVYTNHEKARPVGMTDIITDATINQALHGVRTVTTPNIVYQDAYSGACGLTCTQVKFDTYTDMYNLLTAQNILDVQYDCENPVSSSIINYAAKYDKEMYTWRQCNHYYWFLDDIVDCQIPFLRLTDCYYYVHPNQNFDIVTCASTIWQQSCFPSCDFFLGYMNVDQRPWYAQGCHTYDQREGIYQRTVAGANDYIRQYMHCYQSAPTCQGIREDKYFMLFEQDCDPDTPNLYYSWYVFRFSVKPTDLTDVNYLLKNPQVAAYFGDKDGTLEAHAIALDQHGYVYIHGITNSPAFEGSTVTPSFVWLHAKTHWDLAGEYEFRHCLWGAVVNASCTGFSTFAQYTQTDYSGNAPYPTFISKKFTVPKKFRNVDPSKPVGEQATFSSVYYFNDPTRLSYSAPKGYLMNQEIDVLKGTFIGNAYSNLLPVLDHQIWGYSYAKIAPRSSDLYIFKSKSILNSDYMVSFGLPAMCVQCLFSNHNSCQRPLSLARSAEVLASSSLPTGFTVSNTGYMTDQVEMSLQGSVNSLSEGVYYVDVRITTDDQTAYTGILQCAYSTHGWWWNPQGYNTNDYTQIRRFETSQRIKVIVDEEAIEQPLVSTQLPDVFPVIGLRYVIDFKKTAGVSYFLNCDRFNARMVRNDTYLLSPYRTEQLPSWLTFYERNQSFIVYPIDYDDDFNTTVEVSCCNSIHQCAYQTFHIYPQNTMPIMTNEQTGPFMIQWDNVQQVGEAFNWEMKKIQFYDIDRASDILNTTNYNIEDSQYRKTDQTVFLSFTDPKATFSNQFRQVTQFGLLFGQAYSTIMGYQSLNFKYTDSPITTDFADYSNIQITVNQIPQVTNAGKNYKFANLDPWSTSETHYFDQYFPFLQKEKTSQSILELDTSLWFTDDNILEYQCTRSDSNEVPKYISFDKGNGKLLIGRNLTGSQLLQLKFSAVDTNQGSAKIYKSILLNSSPRAIERHKVIRLSLGKSFAKDLSGFIQDPDGDFVDFSIPKSRDLSQLEFYGLSFSPPTKRLAGRPVLSGTLSLLTLRGSDPHGSYDDIFLTLIIDDLQVHHRSSVHLPSPIRLQASQAFSYQLPDPLFFLPTSPPFPLILYAYDPFGPLPLPSWLSFNPSGAIFSGLAPPPKTQQLIEVRAFNLVSHDSVQVQFRVESFEPLKARIEVKQFDEEISVTQGQWFEYSVKRQVHSGMGEEQRMIGVQGVSQQSAPGFIKWNPDNRTIYGKAAEVGVHRIDIVFSDVYTRKTYINVKITVSQMEKKNKQLIFHLPLFVSVTFGLLIMMTQIYHSNLQLSKTFAKEQEYEKEIEAVNERFGDYHEVDIKFKLPQYQLVDRNRKELLENTIAYAGGEAGALSVCTFDHLFYLDENQDNQEKGKIKEYIYNVQMDPKNNDQNPIFAVVSPRNHYFKPNMQEK